MSIKQSFESEQGKVATESNGMKNGFLETESINLDRCGGLKFCWREISIKSRTCFEKVQGSRSMMIWSAIINEGEIGFVWIHGKMNSKYYTNILLNYLIYNMDELLEEK